MTLPLKFISRLSGNKLRIQDDFGVIIRLPTGEGNKVNVSGAREDVDLAIEYINELLKEFEVFTLA